MPDSNMVKQACDGCRRRKIRCNNVRPCNQCQSASLACHSSLKRQKKGRQGKTANILNQLRAKGGLGLIPQYLHYLRIPNLIHPGPSELPRCRGRRAAVSFPEMWALSTTSSYNHARNTSPPVCVGRFQSWIPRVSRSRLNRVRNACTRIAWLRHFVRSWLRRLGTA